MATIRAATRSGANAIRWRSRIAKKAARAGVYRLMLRAVGTDGQSATTSTRLRLKRR